MRLEQLGFTDVYDYVAGKNDWLAAGLPREGEAAKVLLAGDVADADMPTCTRDESVDEVRARLRDDGHDLCGVIDGDRTVLGLLSRDDAAEAAADATAEGAMQPGPTTIRANEQLEPLLERMRAAETDAVLVTDPEGRLLGLLRVEAAERALARRGESPA